MVAFLFRMLILGSVVHTDAMVTCVLHDACTLIALHINVIIAATVVTVLNKCHMLMLGRAANQKELPCLK